ncbi:hypothetical protein Tco_0339916 [Tanacetum coccineum]
MYYWYHDPPPAPWDQVYTLENVELLKQLLAASSKDPHMKLQERASELNRSIVNCRYQADMTTVTSRNNL